MTKVELIAALADYPDDTVVYLDDIEYGPKVLQRVTVMSEEEAWEVGTPIYPTEHCLLEHE